MLLSSSVDKEKNHKHHGIGVWLLLILIIALGTFIIWGIYKAAFPPKPPLQGQMEARTLSVASKSPGRIAKVMVKEGEMVSKGQPIAEISLPGLQAKLAQTEAQEKAAQARQSLVEEGLRPEQIEAIKAKWDAAKAQSLLAEKTWKRIDALYGDGLVSAEHHDEAKAAWQSASQEASAARDEYEIAALGSRKQEKSAAADTVAEARAAIAEVESLTEDALLVAPRSAQVDRVLLVEGELTAAGFPIVTLVDINDQWVSFNILEKDMPGIFIGKEIIASIPALDKQQVSFEVYYISPRADYATWRSTREDSGYDMKTFEVRARTRQPEPNLRPGMSVLVNR